MSSADLYEAADDNNNFPKSEKVYNEVGVKGDEARRIPSSVVTDQKYENARNCLMSTKLISKIWCHLICLKFGHNWPRRESRKRAFANFNLESSNEHLGSSEPVHKSVPSYFLENRTKRMSNPVCNSSSTIRGLNFCPDNSKASSKNIEARLLTRVSVDLKKTNTRILTTKTINDALTAFNIVMHLIFNACISCFTCKQCQVRNLKLMHRSKKSIKVPPSGTEKRSSTVAPDTTDTEKKRITQKVHQRTFQHMVPLTLLHY